ncbi:MAG TPA: RDD family protein, partial [Mycobacteriales bacterium]|nr:RDD family protein [Mycobacteriales bacterium]
TPGMRATGVVVVRASDGGKPRFRWVLARTALLAAVVPALIPDSSGRSLHDRATGLTMLRSR